MVAEVIDINSLRRTWHRTIQASRQRAEDELTSLASALAWDPDAATDEDVATALAQWAHWTLPGDDRQFLFEDLVHSIKLLDALDTGQRTWEDVLPDLTCTDRTQSAREYVDTCAMDALNKLIYGTGPRGAA